MDDRTQDEGDLLDTDGTDATTPEAPDVLEAEEAETDPSEQEQVIPEEKPVDKRSLAQENELKQINAWAIKIKNSDGKLSVEDMPANLKWLKPKVENVLGLSQVKEEPKVDVKEMVRQEILAERQTMKFDLLKEELNNTLTSEQKASVNAAYKKLQAKGLSGLDSLEMAMEMAHVDIKDVAMDQQYARMKIPTPGRKGKPATSDMAAMPWGEAQQNFTKEERQSYLRKLIAS